MERQELVTGDTINFKSDFRAKSKYVDNGKKQLQLPTINFKSDFRAKSKYVDNGKKRLQLPDLNMVNKSYDKLHRYNKNFKKHLISTLGSDSQILQSSRKGKKRRRVFRPYPCKTVFHYSRKSFSKHRRVKVASCSTESYSESNNEDLKNTTDVKLPGNSKYLFESEPVLPSFSKCRSSQTKNGAKNYSRTSPNKTLHTVPQDSPIGEIFGNLFINVAGKIYCARITCTNVSSYPIIRNPLTEKDCKRKYINPIAPKEVFKEDNTFPTKSLKDRSNEFVSNQNCGCRARLNSNVPSIQPITEKLCNKLDTHIYPKTENLNQFKLIGKNQPMSRKVKGNDKSHLPDANESVLHQKSDTESLNYSESENDSEISLIQPVVHEKPNNSNKFHNNTNCTKNNDVSKLSLVGNAGNYQADLRIRPSFGKVSETLPEFTVPGCRNSNSLFVHKIPKDKISEEELWGKFEKVFRRYARTKRHAGEVIPRKISLAWMTKAGVVNNLVSEMDADEGFRQAAGSKVTLNAQEYKDFLIDLTIRKKLPFYEIYRRMCGL